ncbi:MAG: Uma2 family endonuclease [Acidobacteria bacterium]|nr:Uma2 family endonuclease [Acidobacteriota bacterium]
MNTITEHPNAGPGFIPRPQYSDLILSLPAGARLSLTEISWQEYEDLLVELDEKPHLRLTYDHGDLDIMTLSPEHEGYSRLFTHFIQILTEETDTDFIALGSTTLHDHLVESGVEADDCYYIGEFADVAEKKRLDLSQDPPPDLAVEIDITNRSLGKLPIYALLQVKEVWRFDGNEMRFYVLVGSQYVEQSTSNWFSFLAPETLKPFLQQGRTRGINAMRRAFRDWVQANKK